MPGLDHLLLGCPNLEEGIQEIYHRSGVQPVPGGPHPGMGTHNALLSLKGPLGNQQYLEIIAPDPQQNITPGSMASQLAELAEPALITWAARSTNIFDTAKQSQLRGLAPKGPRKATRLTPNGDLLAWQLLFVDGCERGLPFFIDWLDTPHPSTSAPEGCVLKSFQVFSPFSAQLTLDFKTLNIGVDLREAEKVMLKAILECPKGSVELVSINTLMGFV